MYHYFFYAIIGINKIAKIKLPKTLKIIIFHLQIDSKVEELYRKYNNNKINFILQVSYEDDSELKFVLFEHGDTKITSEVSMNISSRHSLGLVPEWKNC